MAHAIAFAMIRTVKTRTFVESSYTIQLRVQGYNGTAQQRNCPSSAFNDRMRNIRI